MSAWSHLVDRVEPVVLPTQFGLGQGGRRSGFCVHPEDAIALRCSARGRFESS